MVEATEIDWGHPSRNQGVKEVNPLGNLKTSKILGAGCGKWYEKHNCKRWTLVIWKKNKEECWRSIDKWSST